MTATNYTNINVVQVGNIIYLNQNYKNANATSSSQWLLDYQQMPESMLERTIY